MFGVLLNNLSLMFESQIITIAVDRTPEEVYDFVSNPANLPRWASGLGTSIKNVDGKWTADTPSGPITIRFAPRNDLGVLDHYVTIAPGVEVYVPMRVIPNGSGSELTFTLFRQPGMTDQKFKEDAEWVLRDLTKLKDLLQNS